MKHAKNYAEYLEAKNAGMSFDRFGENYCILRGADLYGAKGVISATGLGTENRFCLAYTPKGLGIRFNIGCQYGITGAELLEKSKAKHGEDSKYSKQYSLFVQLAEISLAEYATYEDEKVESE